MAFWVFIFCAVCGNMGFRCHTSTPISISMMSGLGGFLYNCVECADLLSGIF